MTLRVDDIPDLDAPTRERTRALTELGAPARRRTVLRGMALAGATIGATALGWAPVLRASAESSPSGLQGWDAIDCKDGYPKGYDEEVDTEGAYTGRPAACYGGYRIGSTLCDSSGWHRADTVRRGWYETWSYRPISTACGATTTKNAWKWTVGGVTYRCSDGVWTIRYYGYPYYAYLTICRSELGPAPTPTTTPTTTSTAVPATSQPSTPAPTPAPTGTGAPLQ